MNIRTHITANPNPIKSVDQRGFGVTTLSWHAEATDSVEVHVDAPDGPIFSRSGSSGSSTTGKWVSDGTIFYLQDVSNGKLLNSDNTLSKVTINVASNRIAERLRRIVRKLKKQFETGGIIFLYHRVADLELDPWSLCVKPKHFEEHLEVLKRNYCPLRLRQVVQFLQSGKLPRRWFSITFDDGYADNLHCAKPLLERFDLPATAFLTTSHIKSGKEFWWDELTNILLSPGTLPDILNLVVRGEPYRWEFGAASHYGVKDCHADFFWKAWEMPCPGSRHAAYRSIYQLLYNLTETERQQAIADLFNQSGINRTRRPTHFPLSPEEVQMLAQGDIIEVGCHSVTHSLLSMLPPDAQRDEIMSSKAYLENLLNMPVNSFSYPFGKDGEYTKETISLVKEAGFSCACSNIPGSVVRAVDSFQLPRIYVTDCDGHEFEKRLRDWYEI